MERLGPLVTEFLPQVRDGLIFALVLMVGFTLSVPLRTFMRGGLRMFMPRWAGLVASIIQLAILAMGAAGAVIWLEVSTAILLTITAIIGAGASLALSGSVGDLFATLKLLAFDYYRVGEFVQVGEHTGVVLDISAIDTTIRARRYGTIRIKHSRVDDEIIINYSRRAGYEIRVPVPLDVDHDGNEMVRLLINVASHDVGLLDADRYPPQIYHEFQELGEMYQVGVVVPDESDKDAIRSRISLAIKEALGAEGISPRLGLREVEFEKMKG